MKNTIIFLLLFYARITVVNGQQAQGKYGANLPPNFSDNLAFTRIAEDTEIGSVIGTLIGEDDEGSPVIYGVTGESGNYLFNVDPESGIVTLKNSVDRESKSEYTVSVTISDGVNEVIEDIKIIITDVNDNAPRFQNTPYRTSIKEDMPVGSTVIQFNASDPDLSVNSYFGFSFLEETEYFQVNTALTARSGVTSATGTVTLSKALDYESINIYELTVVASDYGTPQQTSHASLIIKIEDVQDTSPIFTGLPYTTSIEENRPIGSLVQTIEAYDQDIGVSNEIEYSIVSGNSRGLFSLGRTSGEIRVADDIDREADGFPGYVDLTVQATELGPSGGAFVQTTFTIGINDINDEMPTFDQSEYSITISENSLVGGVLPLDIHVKDGDQSEFGRFQLSLHGEHSNLFKLEPTFALGETSAMLMVEEQLDYETQQQYELLIYANETSDASHFDSVQVLILLTNENDNRPVFEPQSVSISIYEDLPVGSNVTMVTATDGDVGPYGDITYSLTGSDKFQIDQLTGLITLAESIDYEQTLSYQLTIQAEDGGSPPNVDNARVIVNIIDVNDNAPEFQRQEYFASVDENTNYLPPDNSVIRIRATDRDSPPHNQLTYYILESHPDGSVQKLQNDTNFSLVTIAGSGYLFVVSPLDYEAVTDGRLTLSVLAEDSGGLGASAVLVIEILDKNDHGPVFTKSSYNASIPENLLSGDVVTQVTATDGDLSSALGTTSIVYSVSQSSLFRVNPRNGEVTTAGYLDRDEGEDFFAVEVLAVDGGHGDEQRSATTTVYITITDVNDNNPVFDQVRQTVQVAEDEPIGSSVANVSASDLDEGINGDVTYSLIGGNINDAFEIDSVTGEIKIKSQLDYDETTQVYVLEVLAEDGSVPVTPATGSATATVTVSVLDVNDNVPVFIYEPGMDSYEFSVSEEADPGINIGVVTATDLDSNLNGKIDYNITAGNINDTFNMKRRDSGEIILERLLDREAIDTYHLIITATDRGTVRHSATCDVAITVKDVNDNDPVWLGQPYTVSLAENAPNGTFVFQVSATDADIGTNQKLVYEMNTDNAYYEVDGDTGIIRTRNVPVDREMNSRDMQEIVLTVKDSGRPLRRSPDTATVYVNILDTNDNSPVFENAPYITRVKENLPATTSVYQVMAFDPDLGENGTVSYSIVKTDPDVNQFTIEPSSGIIRLVQPLDRENISNYNVTIETQDGGSDPNVAVTTVEIIVEDDNDHSPVFNASSYQVSVLENASRLTSLLRVFATDDDIESNAEINYFIGSGNEDGKFRIDFQTGILETAAYLDREAVSSYNLTVEAVDNGANARTGSCVVMVTVLDVNDNRPVFVDSNYDVSISEDVTQDEVIVTVHAEDEDIGDNAKITYAIVDGNTDDCFVVDSDTGEIRRGDRPLDRETEESFMLIVEASNSGSEVLRSTVRVSIRVSDVNDEVPVFTQSVYSRPDLSENAGSGTSVVLVSAEDPDLNGGGLVRYSIASGNDDGKFSVDAQTGLIMTQDDLDYETRSNYTLVVTATDQAPPFYTSVATVIVHIVNTNDEPPAFSETRYEGAVQENVAIGTPVITVTAVEYDNQNPIRYEIDPNTNPEAIRLFKIDAVTGVISTDGDIDREVRSFYTISVLANDGGVDKGSATVWITIDDENDNVPVFDVVSDLTVSVLEEEFTPLNSIIGTVRATDMDDGTNAQINYSIESGNDNEVFAVVKNTADECEIRNIKNLDRELQDKYTLEISAYDGGTPSLSSTMTMTVIVIDVNDNAPVFNMSYKYDVTIDENVGGGTLVTTVHAHDADKLGLNGLKYYITDGNSDDTFRMDRNTGEISTRPNPPDRERQSFYNLTVLVQDEEYNNQIQETYIQVLVYIADKNDNPPIFSPTSYTATVREGPGSSSIKVVDVNATDEDLAENAELVYGIVSGDANSLFSIDPQTGEIFTSQELDREVADTYFLVATATDQAVDPDERLTGTATVTLTVEDVNDVAPYFQSSFFGPYYIAEDTSGPFVGSFLAADEDGGLNGHIQYSLLGSVNDQFSISPSDGDLRVKKGTELDREDVDVFNITIVASDRGTPPLSGTTVVQVIVSDINDNDPSFQATPYAVAISEHVPINTSIFTVLATDNDVGPNAHITYSITNGNTENAFSIDYLTGVVRVAKDSLDREVTDQYVLTITAKDNPENPSNARRDGTELIVTILDENDQPPVFSQTSYTGSVMENAAGIAVTMNTLILAEDGDDGSNAVMKYSINGVGSEYFSIDEDSAVVSVKPDSQLDRETESSYTFTVLASDIGGLNNTAEVVVEILDENDNSPVFVPRDITRHVSENAQEGLEVSQVSASDMDSGLNQQVTYRIESGGQDRFTINPDTGLIKIAPGQTLDRELRDQYTLVVIATDRGNPSQSGTGTVNIIVDDINDTPPRFESLSRSVNLPEDSPLGFPASTVSAIDPDVDSLLQYSIISISAFDEEENEIQDPAVFETWFEIDQFSGEVIVDGILDREVVSTVVMTISATDLSSLYPDRSSSDPNMELTVHLTDVNDNDPVFVPGGVTFIHEMIVEKTPGGTVVLTVQAVDADQGLNGRLTYQIIDNDTDLLVITDPSSGLITVNGVIDRKDYTWLNFTVRATDMGDPSRATEIPVYFEIIEVNDNNPEFERGFYEADILENAAIGDRVFVVTATDPDTGSFGEIRYSVVGGIGKFTIDSLNGTISLASTLDREVKADYTLTVTAKDNPSGIPSNRRENSVLVAVTVLDVNDNSPVPTAPSFSFEVHENRAPSTLVGTVTAEDADAGVNGDLLYTIVERTDEDLFFVAEHTGGIYTTEALDREVIDSDGVITMKIQISDQGTPARSVNVSVEITVLDVNDNNPYFEYPLYNVTLSESDFGGTVVFRFRAIDKDQGQTISYSLVEHHLYDEFSLSAQTGDLTIVKSLDYESRPEYLLTIEARDQDGRRGQTQLHITIADTNDQAPIFEVNFYQTTVKEDVQPGTVVGAVNATDADSIREHSIILYYIIDGNPDNTFTVDERTGEVKTNKPLDRESKAEYELKIEARNLLPVERTVNSRILNDFATMIVAIEDVNDVAPIFTKPNYTRRVLENEQTGTIIIEITAVDLDEGTNGEVFYEIVGGNDNGQFDIGRHSGALVLAKLFQRNVQIDFRYDLVIRASDYGVPPLSTNTSVLLQIVDVNDRKPVFINPRSNQTLSIPENEPPGYFITQVLAEDGDLGNNGDVHYGFFKTEGENQDWQHFYINEDSGDLYTMFTADREEKTHYTIVLLAKDHGEPQFETTLTVVIHVEDEDDNAPSFPDFRLAQTMFIQEHSSAGSVVGNVIPAVDPDEGSNARIYYFIVDGNEEDNFYIFKNNGTIILNKELDREMDNQYILTVKASDDPNFGLENSPRQRSWTNSTADNRNEDPTLKKILIDVVDINDNGPVFTKSQYTAGLSIDAKYESELITVVAMDADTGNHSILYYSIVSTFHVDTTSDAKPRPDPDAFKIGRLDGTVRTNELFITFYHGYFELDIFVEDIDHHNDTTVVKIYMLKDNQRVKIVFNYDPDSVKEFREQLISLISNVTGALIHVDDIQYHISEDSEVDFGKTDVLIHAVDPHTNTIMDVNHIIEIIDENYSRLENLFKVYNVIEIVPAIPLREHESITLLQAALVAIGILLFIGVFIYTICICWIKHKHRSKLEAIATFSFGASTSDLLRDSSYQGSNPLWIDNYSWISDWPDNLSHLDREYEAQEITMDFFHDDEDHSQRKAGKPGGRSSLVTFSPVNGMNKRTHVLHNGYSRSPSSSDVEIEMLPPSGDSDTDDSPGLLSGNSTSSLSEPELNGDLVPMRELTIDYMSRRALTPISEEDSSSFTSKTDTVKTTGSRNSSSHADDEAENGSSNNRNDIPHRLKTVEKNERKDVRAAERLEPVISPGPSNVPEYHRLDSKESEVSAEQNILDTDSDSESSSGSDGACQIYHVNPEYDSIGLNIPVDHVENDEEPLFTPNRESDPDTIGKPGNGISNPGFQDNGSHGDSREKREPGDGITNDAFEGDDHSVPDSQSEPESDNRLMTVRFEEDSDLIPDSQLETELHDGLANDDDLTSISDTDSDEHSRSGVANSVFDDVSSLADSQQGESDESEEYKPVEFAFLNNVSDESGSVTSKDTVRAASVDSDRVGREALLSAALEDEETYI